jgi:hypothetical protein
MTTDALSEFRPDWTFQKRLGLALTNPEDVIEGGVWGFFLVVEGVGLVVKVIEAANLDHGAPENIRRIERLREEFILSSVMFSGTCSSSLGWLHRAHVIDLGRWESPISAFGYSARIFTSSWRAAEGVGEFNDFAERAENTASSTEYHKARQQQTLSLLKVAANVLAVAWSVLGIVAIATGSVVLFPIIDGLFLLAMAFWIGEAWMKMHIHSEEKRQEGTETISVSASAQRV